MPTEFTPLAALGGGALIGLAAALLMLGNGRIAGISGILGRLLPPWQGADGDRLPRLAFLAGLIAAPLLLSWSGLWALPAAVLPGGGALMAAAGLLVGIGTTLGSGCTSGHGVCGLARLSKRSLAATLMFMATAIATVYVQRHLLGGAP